MILIGLGANLPTERFGPPRQTLTAALAAMAERGFEVVRRSHWYRSGPVPPSDQPDFVNAVAEVSTDRPPGGVLDILHAIEADFGRERRVRWGARRLDLDLLAYHDQVIGYESGTDTAAAEGPVIPHPRLHERQFVLAPLAELAPDWRHPVLGRTAAEMLASLPADERVEMLPEPDEPA